MTLTRACDHAEALSHEILEIHDAPCRSIVTRDIDARSDASISLLSSCVHLKGGGGGGGGGGRGGS